MFQTWNCTPTADKLAREINQSSKSQERAQDEEINQLTYKTLAGFIRFRNHNVKHFLSYRKAQPPCSSSTAITCHSTAGKLLGISAQLPGTRLQTPAENKNQHICFHHFWHCLDPEQLENTHHSCLLRTGRVCCHGCSRDSDELGLRNTK